MTETKVASTQGPWEAVPDIGGAFSICHATSSGTASNIIAFNVLEHNAPLIASAPDLVKALEGVLHHNAGTKPEYQLPQSLVRHVESALAKARGK